MRHLIREEDEIMNGIRRRRVDGVEREDYSYEDERGDPSMLQRISFPLLEEASCLPPFREGLFAVSIILRLFNISWVQQPVKGRPYLDRPR